ncbi:hypothetical protein NWQ33_06565 [Mycoplasmopsis cynos]|nr:hypothetical protein [Mycoplasmopsis cynos]
MILKHYRQLKKACWICLIKPKEFYSYSIKQLSFKINISIGTISKLIKKIGFSSLKDMQFYIFHNYLNSNLVNHTEDYEKNSDILIKLFNYYKESISQTAYLLSLDEVNALVNDI